MRIVLLSLDPGPRRLWIVVLLRQWIVVSSCHDLRRVSDGSVLLCQVSRPRPRARLSR